MNLVRTNDTSAGVTFFYESGDYKITIQQFTDGEFNISALGNSSQKLPTIYWFSDDPTPTIQTTSYGSLAPEEIIDVINGYEIALDVADLIVDEVNALAQAIN